MKKEINPENIVRDFMLLAKLPFLPPARREALRQAIEKELERIDSKLDAPKKAG